MMMMMPSQQVRQLQQLGLRAVRTRVCPSCRMAVECAPWWSLSVRRWVRCGWANGAAVCTCTYVSRVAGKYQYGRKFAPILNFKFLFFHLSWLQRASVIFFKILTFACAVSFSSWVMWAAGRLVEIFWGESGSCWLVCFRCAGTSGAIVNVCQIDAVQSSFVSWGLPVSEAEKKGCQPG